MKYYLIDNDQEHHIELRQTQIHSNQMVEFEFAARPKDVNPAIVQDQTKIYIRVLAGMYFASENGVKWKKIARQDLPAHILHVDTVYQFYRGFKPSGLAAAEQGELLTKMPGKVIKIPVKPGQSIIKGQTLIIIEAMKMENEIKSAVDGVIKTIHVKEGDLLSQNVLMMEVAEKQSGRYDI